MWWHVQHDWILHTHLIPWCFFLMCTSFFIYSYPKRPWPSSCLVRQPRHFYPFILVMKARQGEKKSVFFVLIWLEFNWKQTFEFTFGGILIIIFREEYCSFIVIELLYPPRLTVFPDSVSLGSQQLSDWKVSLSVPAAVWKNSSQWREAAFTCSNKNR